MQADKNFKTIVRKETETTGDDLTETLEEERHIRAWFQDTSLLFKDLKFR